MRFLFAPYVLLAACFSRSIRMTALVANIAELGRLPNGFDA
jgi:hypothetical protein